MARGMIPLQPTIIMQILHTVLYILQVTDKENLFNNQDFPRLMINFFILMTLICDVVRRN